MSQVDVYTYVSNTKAVNFIWFSGIEVAQEVYVGAVIPGGGKYVLASCMFSFIGALSYLGSGVRFNMFSCLL